MKIKIIGILFFCTFIFSVLGSSCKSNSPQNQNLKSSEPPSIEVLKYETLFERLLHDNDTLILVNFWATWCQPCVKELPHFHEVVRELKLEGKPIRFIMVTIDKASDLQSTVVPFIQKNGYEFKHILLDDNGRMNEWIPKVHPDWQGDIPATAVYKGGTQVAFKSGMISKENLSQLLRSFF